MGAVDSMDGEQIVAVAAVVMREGRVLAMRRSAQKDAGAGIWETLSGRIVPGEAPFDAMRREIAEESGLEVELDPRPIDAYEARRAGRPMVVIVYRARWIAGEVVRSVEHDAHAWCTPDELEARTSLSRLVQAVRRALSTPWP